MARGNPNPVDRRENLIAPEEAPLKHGLRARPGNLMRCNRCAAREACGACERDGLCRIEADYLLRRRKALLTLPHLNPELDGPLLDQMLWYEVRVQRAARALAVTGELLPGAEQGYGEYNPLAVQVQPIMNTLLKLYQVLGITPAMRRALAADMDQGNPLAAAILLDAE